MRLRSILISNAVLAGSVAVLALTVPGTGLAATCATALDPAPVSCAVTSGTPAVCVDGPPVLCTSCTTAVVSADCSARCFPGPLGIDAESCGPGTNETCFSLCNGPAPGFPAAVCISKCGNGKVDSEEECDDGNTIAGDCCSPTCKFEASDTIGSPPCCFMGDCLEGATCGTACFTPGICELAGINNSGACTCSAGLCLQGLPPTTQAGSARYTITTVSGGTLAVGPLPAFPFPSGTTTIIDNGAFGPNCVEESIVPFPGGFTAPHFCVPALGFTVTVKQTGCGQGRVDTNAGSDYSITERGDTSDTLGVCGFGDTSCTFGTDSNIHVDVTVGDGVADTCGSHCKFTTPGAGAPCGPHPDVATCGGDGACIKDGNALVSIPVDTVTWADVDGSCPDTDGTFNPGTDGFIVSFPQTLDFTTDTATAVFADLDSDGCSLAGTGGTAATPGMAVATGACLNTATVTTGGGAGSLTLAAAGAIGSAGTPLYDLLFATVQPSTIVSTGTAVPGSCVQQTPFQGGTTTRCIR